MALMQSTRQSVSLTLHVVREDDSSISIFVYPLMSLTWLIMAVWQGMSLVNTLHFNAVVWWLDTLAGIEIVWTWFTIAFNSAMFGMRLAYEI